MNYQEKGAVNVKIRMAEQFLIESVYKEVWNAKPFNPYMTCFSVSV